MTDSPPPPPYQPPGDPFQTPADPSQPQTPQYQTQQLPYQAYPPQYAPQQYPPQQYWQPAAPNPGTNGFSIAAMVLGIIWIWWIGSILAVIFGHIALAQIKKTGQGGHGMAVAGLVLGYIGVGVLLLAFAVGIASGFTDSTG
jgi:hypothetical protein